MKQAWGWDSKEAGVVVVQAKVSWGAQPLCCEKGSGGGWTEALSCWCISRRNIRGLRSSVNGDMEWQQALLTNSQARQDPVGVKHRVLRSTQSTPATVAGHSRLRPGRGRSVFLQQQSTHCLPSGGRIRCVIDNSCVQSLHSRRPNGRVSLLSPFFLAGCDVLFHIWPL